jgi:hypothetical protein
LRQITNPKPRAQIHRQPSNVFIREPNTPGFGRFQADDHVKGRRLTGAIRSEQPNDFAGLNVQRDIVDYASTTVRLSQTESRKCARRRSFGNLAGNPGGCGLRRWCVDKL